MKQRNAHPIHPFGALLLVAVTFSTGVCQEASQWKFESQRPELAPHYSIDNKVTYMNKPTLLLHGAGKEHVDGHWYKIVSVKAGENYLFSSFYRAENVDEPARSILARIIWLRNERQIGFTEYPVTLPAETKDGWREFNHRYQVPAEVNLARIELHYRWDGDGSVRFSEVSFSEVTPQAPRKVRLATVYHRPRGTRHANENLDQFAQLVDRAGAAKADIVCLPEAITMVGTPNDYVSASESIPGPSTERLGAVAKKNNLYIVAGLLERDGEIVYNTAVLIDRSGKLVGKYRKVSLPREEIDGGITPGNSFPVFVTDFGKVGMMICWDVTFPEGARMLAQNGAEMIFLPIAGGHLKLAMARALENQVYLVSSSYDMISAVFDLEGNVIAEADAKTQVVVTEIDLTQQKLWPWIGDLKSRIPREMPSTKALRTNH